MTARRDGRVDKVAAIFSPVGEQNSQYEQTEHRTYVLGFWNKFLKIRT